MGADIQTRKSHDGFQGEATEPSRVSRRCAEPSLWRCAALGLLFPCGLTPTPTLLAVLVWTAHFLCSEECPSHADVCQVPAFPSRPCLVQPLIPRLAASCAWPVILLEPASSLSPFRFCNEHEIPARTLLCSRGSLFLPHSSRGSRCVELRRLLDISSLIFATHQYLCNLANALIAEGYRKGWCRQGHSEGRRGHLRAGPPGPYIPLALGLLNQDGQLRLYLVERRSSGSQ